jgi:hypothetical protein
MQWYNKPLADLGKKEETKDQPKKKMVVGMGG